MKKTYYILLSLFIILCATCTKQDMDAHQQVRQAAEKYYSYLIKGDVDKYVQGIHDYDELPDDYRSQLRDMFLQYLDHERTLRGGIVSAHALRDTLIDSLRAQVFIELQFGDSTREEVSLPLIHTNKGWCMK